jgi:ferredoxin-NADP reductase
MSMLRLARRTQRTDLLRLVASVRAPSDLYYARELPGPEVTIVYTRVAPSGSARPVGRLKPDDLADAFAPAYVCGSPGFAEAATELLIGAGVPAGEIRVELFGPTG